MTFQQHFTKMILLSICLLFTLVTSGSLSRLNAEELEGDVNGDGVVNLEDARIGLKVITLQAPQTIEPSYPLSGADVGENTVIGIEEPIFALQQPTRKDSDNDGWPDIVDCQPEDPDIHPGAQEICDDGIDNDCDGIPDFSDKDKDGFFALACGGDDSDDGNAKINPASLEVCNDGIDNNGNGLVDENDLGCFPGCDQDEDGYASSECGGIDADDNNPRVYPFANEICNDFIDNNQNGAIDEGCQSDQLAFGASSLSLISNDSRVLKILLNGYPEDETEWEYLVEGVVGGNQTVGTINVLPVSSGVTFYIAPEVSEVTLFSIAATDPQDENRTVSTEVTVYPVTGALAVVPANAIIGLTRKKQFNAILDIQNIGKIPVKNPVWYVNGVEGGGINNGVDLGKINTNGLYTAPNKMPGSLPVTITVGFSLTKGQAALALSDIKLSELKAGPSPIVAMDTGNAGVIIGQRLLSDGTVNNINAADLGFAPANQHIATVNNAGTVMVGNALGKTVVFVTDRITGAMDAVTIISRTDIDLSIEVLSRSFDTSRVSANASDASEVEYTCPGGMYDIRASVKRLRGPQAGKSITVAPSRTVKDIFGQDPNKDIPLGSIGVDSQSSRILDYEPPADSVPHATSVLGILRKDTGLVIVGDEQGTGDIVVNYDDGFVTHQATLKHIYTRPDITVQTIGRRSNSTEPYLTEEINVTLEAKNNGGHSVFVGELPIQVTLLDQDGNPEIMDVFYRNSPFSGYAWGSDTPLNLNMQTEAMDFTLASTADPLDGSFFGGRVKFRFFARSAGLHTLVVENKCDPTAPKVLHTIMIKKPPLSLRHVTNEELDPQSPWVVGSWLKVYHIPKDITNRVSIYDMYSRDSVESFSRNDLPRWTVTDPFLTETSIPLVDDSLVDQSGQTGTGGTLPFVPTDTGQWKVNLSFTQRAYLKSDDLILNVVEPTAVTAVELEAQEDDWAGAIKRGNTLGAIQIAPVPDRWIQGVPIPITIQTFSADPNDHTSKTIGRRLTTQYIQDGKLSSQSVTVSVAGVSISSASGHTLDVDGNLFPTDTPGEFAANIIVTDGPSDKDLILRINAAIHSPSDETAISGILAENRVINTDNNSRGRTPENGNGLAIARFVDTKNKTFINQCALIPGRGLAFSPRQLPITSARVKQAVQEQRIPVGKDKVIVYAEGTGTGFISALGSGVSTTAFSGFPANLVVEKTEIENGRLKITLDTSAVTASGRHEIVVTLNDGEEWTGPVQLVKIELDHPQDHDNEHIPLNGNHHEMHPVGSNMVIAKNNSSGDSSVPNSARIHLFPSLKPGDPQFRGQDIDQPLVGWRRELNDQREFEVSLLEQDWLMQRNNFVIVYGNIMDKATYDPVSGTLSRGEGPDMLPDFVSRKMNAETVAVSVAGNFADAMFFTAFNFIAEAEPDDATKVPEVDFDTLKDGPIETVYSTYRGGGTSNLFDSDPQSATSTLAEGRSNKIVSVSVDTETGLFTRLCPGTDQCEDASFKYILSSATNRVVPAAYHGGILDQYFLAELRGSPYTVPPGVFRAPIGQDGRVGAFDGEFGENGCRPGTSGAIVECFGIELDGVLYDPALLINDLPPNHKEFLEIPLVDKYAQAFAPGWESWLDDGESILKLFPDIGGTSGGRFDLQTRASTFDPDTGERRSRPFQGAHKVLAKTPGQDFPGIYAGYPIQGTALDLKTPYAESVKDDIDDAALKRNHPVGPLTGERTDTLGFGHKRRMMTYGSNHDKKAPISTSLTRNIDFSIMTDPPGLDDIKFRAALRVRELPREYGDNIDLIVTTMSDGWEDLIKLTYDTTIDIIAEIIAKIALNAVTGGTYTAACALNPGDTAGTLLKGALKSRIEKVTIDAIGTELHVPDYFGIDEHNPLYGRRRTPQLTFKALDPDVLQGGAKPISLGAQSTFRKLIKENLDGPGGDSFSGQLFSNTQGIIKDISLCNILKQPITIAAGMVKDLISKESLGGGGAANATASKVMVVIIPDEAAQDLDGKRVAWFQVDKSLMITPDEEKVHDINLALNPEISSDKGSNRSEHDLVKDLIVMMNTNIPGSGKYNEAAWFLKLLNSPTHVVKRSPDGTLSSALIDTYEDYRVRISSLPTMGATVVPNGTVSDFKLTTGTTKIPVTVSSFVTALRSNENAGARASIKSNGYEMIPLAASIPGPFDQ